MRLLVQSRTQYLCLTDMVKARTGSIRLGDWMRNRQTLEFLGVWETVHNPDFKRGEFATIRKAAGRNDFRLSVREWVGRTNAIGLHARPGRYGGTFAHPDIAFEFGMWISPAFKVYLVKEYQRLKGLEKDWSLKRQLAAINYAIHTDAVKRHLIPKRLGPREIAAVYASEADLLNMALFGMTAAEFRKRYPEREGTLRDYATPQQLVCLVNLENLNAHWLSQSKGREERLRQLNALAIDQMRILQAHGNLDLE